MILIVLLSIALLCAFKLLILGHPILAMLLAVGVVAKCRRTDQLKEGAWPSEEDYELAAHEEIEKLCRELCPGCAKWSWTWWNGEEYGGWHPKIGEKGYDRCLAGPLKHTGMRLALALRAAARPQAAAPDIEAALEAVAASMTGWDWTTMSERRRVEVIADAKDAGRAALSPGGGWGPTNQQERSDRE